MELGILLAVMITIVILVLGFLWVFFKIVIRAKTGYRL